MSGYTDCRGCLTHTSLPTTLDFTAVEAPQHPLISLAIPPARGLATTLHRRRAVWYIVWGRGYGMASSKHVATLNQPQDSDPPFSASPPSGRHRFWFNSDNNVFATLENMLDADTPCIRLTGRSRMETCAVYGSKAEIEAKEVEVLICDEGLSRKCAFCGQWENVDGLRYLKVGMDKEDPLYWCRSGVNLFFIPLSRLLNTDEWLFQLCIKNNSQSVMAKLRRFPRKSTQPSFNEYFGSW